LKFTRKKKPPLSSLWNFTQKNKKPQNEKKKLNNFKTSKYQNKKPSKFTRRNANAPSPSLWHYTNFFLKNPKLITRKLKFSKISTYPNKKPSTSQEERQITITKGKVSLFIKWFHWILNEFTSCNEQGLVKSNEFIGLMNGD